jgi:hypothetical protein
VSTLVNRLSVWVRHELVLAVLTVILIPVGLGVMFGTRLSIVTGRTPILSGAIVETVSLFAVFFMLAVSSCLLPADGRSKKGTIIVSPIIALIPAATVAVGWGINEPDQALVAFNRVFMLVPAVLVSIGLGLRMSRYIEGSRAFPLVSSILESIRHSLLLVIISLTLAVYIGIQP